MGTQPPVEWNGLVVSANEKLALEYLEQADNSVGTTPEEVRHLFKGEPLTARRTLQRLADKKILKKKVTKRVGTWAGQRVSRKVALFFLRD